MINKDLIGRVITAVTVRVDGIVLTTYPDQKETGKREATNYLVSAEGDCCSSGWIGAVRLPDLPAKITEVANCWECDDSDCVEALVTDVPEVPNKYHPDCLQKVTNDGPAPRRYIATGETGDCLVVYGFKIETGCGPIILDIWNDSNGYYGSSVNISETA